MYTKYPTLLRDKSNVVSKYIFKKKKIIIASVLTFIAV